MTTFLGRGIVMLSNLERLTRSSGLLTGKILTSEPKPVDVSMERDILAREQLNRLATGESELGNR